MEENCAQAYLQLIQTLLNCPNVEENQILNANSELVDAKLVQAMVIVAAQLSENNQENAATFLLQTATQIANLLGMNDGGDSNDSEGKNFQEYENFIGELLQAEQDSNSDRKVTYPMLGQRQHLLSSRFAEILQQVVQNLIAAHPEAIKSILGDIENLSIDISNCPLGSRANNLEIAITGYQIVLNNREPGSEKWAMTQNNLANAYSYRIRGEKAENIELAIASYTAALTVRTREAFPQNPAETLFNLGLAYRDVPNFQGKRILSITRGFSTITRLYCCLLRTVFPPVALLSLLKRYIWEFRN